jgi:hypothetical protein
MFRTTTYGHCAFAHAYDVSFVGVVCWPALVCCSRYVLMLVCMVSPATGLKRVAIVRFDPRGQMPPPNGQMK